MNFGSVPKIPTAPAIPQAPAVPTHLGQDVGAGPAQGNVGIGAPQHFDPNNPSVRLDGTVHNPTGVGGDLKVSREVSVNDLKNIPTPDIHAPDLSLPSGASGGGNSSGGGFSMPSLGNPLSGLSMPDMPTLPSMPSMPSLPDMPSLGNPFSGISAPDLSLPSLPDFGNPFSGLSGPDLSLPDMPSMGTPGMPGFRFLELPDLPDIELDLSEWDLLPSFDIPDWEGDSESERQKPDTRAKKTDKVKVEIRLETEEGTPFPNVPVQVRGTKDFRFQGNLDRDGILCVEVPRGKLDVSLVDTPQLEQRLLAARLVQAIQSKQLDRIPPLLVMARADFRALEKSVQDLDRGTFDSVASRIRVLFTQAGRQGEVEPLLCLLETATYSGDRPTSMRIHAAQTAPFHDGILGFFVDSIQAGSLEAEWALFPVWDDRTTTPTGTRCLSPLGKTASVCFPASAGRWMLVACIPGVAAAAKEFTVHDKDAVLAPDMPLDELDPTAFVGVVRKCGQWLAALDSEDRLDEDPSWSALATTASQILDAAGQMGGMRFAIHGPSEGSVRACLASDDSGWAILDWSDSALASGQIVWKCDSSAPSRDPIFVLQHWLDTATSAPERVSAAIPDASNGRDLSSGSLRIVEARSATSKSPTTNAGMVTLWYRMVARACKRPRPLRDLDVGLNPISPNALPQGLWKDGSHKVDLALAIANQSEGILGGFSSREWEPGTKVNLDGCTLDSWSRPQGEWTEHVLCESSAMEGIRSLVDNRRVTALERLSLLLGEIGSLLEQGKLRSHVRRTDSTDPRENWSARGPVSCSSLDVVGFTTKSPSCKLVASTWKPGTLEEHPSTNLPQASTRTGMIRAQFQTFAGLPLPLDTVELVRQGNVVWKGSAVEGKVRIDNLPLDGYLFRVTFQGRPLDLSVAWEPSDTTDPAQICRLPFSLEA